MTLITLRRPLIQMLTPSWRQLLQIAIVRRVQRHNGLTHHFLFLTFGRSDTQSLALSPERQSARMSNMKIFIHQSMVGIIEY